MASVSRQIFRLVLAAGAVPAVGVAVGYRMRMQQMSASTLPENRVYQVHNLPLYPTKNQEEINVEFYPRNSIEAAIGDARKSVVDLFKQYEESFQAVATTIQTGVEHSKLTLDYIQNNPGEFPRVVFIAVAAMGGVVLGYKGGVVKKVTYGTIAGLSCASLCYPKRTVELTSQTADYIQVLWRDVIGGQDWPQAKKPEEKIPGIAQATNISEEADVKLSRKLEGDPGQSNPADKDMYSTRTS